MNNLNGQQERYAHAVKLIANRFSFRRACSFLQEHNFGLEDFLSLDDIESMKNGRLGNGKEEKNDVKIRDFLIDLSAHYPRKKDKEKIGNLLVEEDTLKTKADIFEMYKEDISRFEPTTPEEEAKYGKIIQAYKDERRLKEQVKYVLHILKKRKRAKDTQNDIALLEKLFALPYEINDETYLRARNELIEKNLRLVINIAFLYRNRKDPEFLDCIQEGNIGLLNAVEKWNPANGRKFSSYAGHSIKNQIITSLVKNSRIIEEPRWIIKAKKAYEKLCYITLEKLGRLPTTEEMKQELNGSKGNQDHSLSEETLAYIRRTCKMEILSIDGSDAIKKNEQQMLNKLVHNEEKNMVWTALNDLDPKSVYVVCARHGLGNYDPLTLEQISEILNETKHNVGYVQRQATRRIKEKLTLYVKHGMMPIRRNTGLWGYTPVQT